jgi:hypothetical protein
MMWRLFFDPNVGFANQFLSWFGIPAQPWLSGQTSALPTLVFIDVWQWTPMIVLILLACLTSLSEEPDEAARLDGADPVLPAHHRDHVDGQLPQKGGPLMTDTATSPPVADSPLPRGHTPAAAGPGRAPPAPTQAARLPDPPGGRPHPDSAAVHRAFNFVSYASIHWGSLMSAAVIVTVPIMVIALFTQKYVVSGLTAGATKG